MKTIGDYQESKFERLSRDELESAKFKKLKKQINYVFKHSPFYQNKFRQAGIRPTDIRLPEDIRIIPFTTKEELRESQVKYLPYGNFLCIPVEQITRCAMTTGTTGAPLLLPRNIKDDLSWIDLNARAAYRSGIRTKDIVQFTFTYHWLWGAGISSAGIMKVGAQLIHSGGGMTERQIHFMKLLGTTVMVGTPSYLLYIARKANELRVDVKSLALRRVLGGGEAGMSLPETKKRFHEAFPTIEYVQDLWGFTEIGSIQAIECEAQNGLHLTEDAVFHEILDVNTHKPVEEGKEGELIISDLVNTTMPLLRYRVKDIVTFTTDPCPCGRTLGRFPKGIVGRTDDCVTIRSVNFFPSAVDDFLKSIPELNGEYQIIIDRVHDVDELTIKAEVNPGVESIDNLRKKIEAGIKNTWGFTGSVVLLAPESLPRFTFKAMRLIDKRKGQTEEDAIKRALEQSKTA